MRLVVDASVAVKWLFPEVDEEAAKRVLKSAREILAPDLIWAEVGNAALKKISRKEVSVDEAAVVMREFQNYPLQITESKTLVDTALVVAHDIGLSLYDALYLSLSYDRDCSLVTADRKLYDRVRQAYPQTETIWLENFKA